MEEDRKMETQFESQPQRIRRLYRQMIATAQALVEDNDEFSDDLIDSELLDAHAEALTAFQRALAGEEHYCQWALHCHLSLGHELPHRHEGPTRVIEWGE